MRVVTATVFGCLAMLVSCLPFSEINASVGVLVAAVGAGPGATTWIADAYAVALAAVVLPSGTVTARFGARCVTALGLGATVLGACVLLTVGALSSAALPLLLAGAAICGTGGGLVMSASLALVGAAAASDGDRRRDIGRWAAALVVGLAGGPFLAAAVLAIAPWFAVLMPAAVLAVGVLVLGRRVAETPVMRVEPDVLGAILAAGSVLALVTGIAGLGGGGGSGGDSTIAVALLASGLALAVALVVVEHRRGTGLLRLDMFFSPGFDAAAVASAAALFTMAGLVVVVSISLTPPASIHSASLSGCSPSSAPTSPRASWPPGCPGVWVGGASWSAVLPFPPSAPPRSPSSASTTPSVSPPASP